MLKRLPGLTIGTLLMFVAVVIIVLLDRVGLVSREWVNASAWKFQAARVCVVVGVVAFAITPVIRVLDRHSEDNWDWLVKARWRLLFWYLAMEILLFIGT